jgi:hypothetical protein
LNFAAPTNDGGAAVSSYTVTSNPGGITATGTASPIVVDGLTNGTSYDFTVTATNAAGASPASVASNGVTPTSPSVPPVAAVGVPTAPGIYDVVAQVEGASLFLSPPSSNGGSVVTSYIATSNPGGITGTSEGASGRIDMHGLTGGTSYTFTVQAVNANGTGAASAPSSSITATPYADYWVAHGFSSGINPAWGTAYTFSGNSNYASTAVTPLYGTTVVQMDVTSAWGGFQPYILAAAPLSPGGNGIFDLTPYTYMTFSVWPTIGGNAQKLSSYFEASHWFFGVLSAGSNSTTIVDTTQNWTPNQWAGYIFADTKRNSSQNIVSNTATTLTLASGVGTTSAGDSYAIVQPDVPIGAGVQLPGAYGPNPMVSGQWNTYTIPLSAFNAAGSSVTGALILKFGIQDQTGASSNTFYVCNIGFY